MSADIIGDDYPTDAPNRQDLGRLNKSEIEILQEDILRTLRPRWYTPPPARMGEKGAGKLKADQWRSYIEFDLPVSLLRLQQVFPQSGDDAHNKRRQELVQATFYLAMAVRWGTSHCTSSEHTQKYLRYMTLYLTAIRDMGHVMKPNHHAALHIPDFLLRYGPVHGWWMYPFERVIGILQQMNTNNRLGKSLLYSSSIKHSSSCIQATWREPC